MIVSTGALARGSDADGPLPSAIIARNGIADGDGGRGWGRGQLANANANAAKDTKDLLHESLIRGYHRFLAVRKAYENYLRGNLLI